MDKPEALRLADRCESLSQIADAYSAEAYEQAAAELRRLHQFAEDQIGRATAAEAALQMTKATHALKIAAVETQRDALLEALRAAVADWDEEVSRGRWLDAARAAIKKAEEA